MNNRKSEDIGVSCINLASQTAGSNSIYNENSRATTIVTTKGTRNDQDASHTSMEQVRLTVLCHGLSIWRSHT